jgi:antitoxin MazE
MRTKLVPIGNSKGLRLPKSLIEQCGFGDEIEMEPRVDCLVLRPVRAARTGWDAAFARMRARGDDTLLLDAGAGSDFDEKEWTW